MMAVSTILLVISLGSSLAIAAATRNDPIAFMIFQTSERLFELFYCSLVIVTFWKTLKKQPSARSTSQTPTKEDSKEAQNSQSQTQSKPNEREISS
jgi:hypothetical protein